MPYKAAISFWRKAINKTSILNSNVNDIDQIRHARDQVVSTMNEINDFFCHLTLLPVESHEKLHYSDLCFV